MAAVASSPPTLGTISSDSEEEAEKGVKTEGNSGKKKKNSTKGRGNSKKKRRRHSDVEIWTADEKELNDDDCCILPSNPNGEIELKNTIISDPKQDDVSVLAERGKVACRDYPHPRHSCAKYPFSKTSHENCCSQCYCYVCDVSAPCSYWKGLDGHCHASNHDKKWSSKRRALRLAKKCMLKPCSTKICQ